MLNEFEILKDASLDLTKKRCSTIFEKNDLFSEEEMTLLKYLLILHFCLNTL